MIYVVGHKNPDADSICSAIAYAELLRKKGYHSIAVRAGELNKETIFALEYFGAEIPPKIPDKLSQDDVVYLVDHNEMSQMAECITEDVIVGIIDHHKLGGLKTPKPIFVRIEPLGSTCTILSRVYREEGIEITRKIAGLLLTGILSDTVLFKSATTTSFDEEEAIRLSKIAETDIEQYGMELLKKKSDIEDVSPKQILTRDFKEFDFSGHRVGISQVELVDMSLIEPKIGDIVEEMRKMVGEGYELIVFMVTDVIEEGSRLYVVGNSEAVETFEEAFGGGLNEGYIYLKGVMSRKSQVVPPLERAFSKKGCK